MVKTLKVLKRYQNKMFRGKTFIDKWLGLLNHMSWTTWVHSSLNVLLWSQLEQLWEDVSDVMRISFFYLHVGDIFQWKKESPGQKFKKYWISRTCLKSKDNF